MAIKIKNSLNNIQKLSAEDINRIYNIDNECMGFNKFNPVGSNFQNTRIESMNAIYGVSLLKDSGQYLFRFETFNRISKAIIVVGFLSILFFTGLYA